MVFLSSRAISGRVPRLSCFWMFCVLPRRKSAMLMPSSVLASGRRILSFSRPAARSTRQNGCVPDSVEEARGRLYPPGPGYGAQSYIWRVVAGLVSLLSYWEFLQTVFLGFTRAGAHLPKGIFAGSICVRFVRIGC